MATLNAAQTNEVTFLSGVAPGGIDAAQSFWTWNDDAAATYSTSLSYEAKWGAPSAGTGASISFAFNAASGWTPTEQSAFMAAMHLWSAEANVTFHQVGQAEADVVISRASDQTASGGIERLVPGSIGSTQLGVAHSGSVDIDTSVTGFGPIGAGFSVAGGYAWTTILHELGHVIGLGHGGAYNDGTTTTHPMYSAYDTTAWTLMSYNDAPRYDATDYRWGSSDGYQRAPTTPMALDIAAAQTLYGAPVDSPLSGGQVFGFHTNIQGDIAQFFDFTKNTTPIVTLYDSGGGNTLDLSGFAIGNDIDLHDGTFSSVMGLHNNIAIAYGTRIDTAIGGSGSDHVLANDNADVLMGGGGGDSLTGGAGNDHIYGNMATGSAGTTDGDDTIEAGGGVNYVNGNAGNDTISAHGTTNRLYGGQGDDQITTFGTGVAHVNGNLGDDTLIAYAGFNDLHGGQGNDRIVPVAGDNHSFGEAGNDVMGSGYGSDVMTGGAGADLFILTSNYANPGNWGEITDFTHGTDRLYIDTHGGGIAPIIYAQQSFADETAAADWAHAALGNVSGSEASSLQVGSDVFLFYKTPNMPASSIEVTKLDNVLAGSITSADFVTVTSHL